MDNSLGGSERVRTSSNCNIERLTILAIGLVFASLLLRDFVSAQQNLSAEQLYQKWSDNRQTDSSVAYKAAQEYLSRFPDGKYTKLVQAWNTAYEKVISQTT